MDLRGVAMVTRAGTVRTELAGGLADAAAGIPCTARTRFQICSISKQFAAVAALLLAEDGRLALDDPVDRWLPGGRLAAIQAAPLRTAPGETWHYSSPGFVLVGLIVERASGQPYARFLTERILAPLGLAATSVGGAPPEPAARGYRDGAPVTPFDLAAMAGTGDIWSTAADLASFTAARHAET